MFEPTVGNLIKKINKYINKKREESSGGTAYCEVLGSTLVLQ